MRCFRIEAGVSDYSANGPAIGRRGPLAGPEFAGLWTTHGGVPVLWVCEDPDCGSVSLAGVEFGRGLLTRFQALPESCFCELLYTETEMPRRDRVTAGLMDAIREHNYARAVVSNYFGQMTEPPRWRSQQLVTQIIDIASTDWEPPDATLRSEIRKAQREPLTIEEFDSERHFSAFMALAELTAARQKRHLRFRREFFVELARLAEQTDTVVWRFCHANGIPVASHIYLVYGDDALYWQAYADRGLSTLKANQWLLYETIRMLHARGVRRINLGMSPPGADSLERYKEAWGAQLVNYLQFECRNWLGRIL